MSQETALVAAAAVPSGAESPGSGKRPDGDAPARPRWRRIVAVLVLAGGLGLLVPGVVHSLETTSSLNSGPIVNVTEHYYQQLTCYRDTIEHHVPKGSRVYLGAVSSDEQLLVEASVAWASILPTPAGAQYRIAIAHGRGACNGTELEITPT